LAQLIEEVDDLSQPLEVQQRQIGVALSRRGELVGLVRVGPAHRNGRVCAISQAQDQVGVDTSADEDDLTLLATQRVVGMGDGHIFQKGLG
jgi:hypothetical protein